MTDSNTIGIIAALGSALSWSIGAILFKRLGASLPSFAMTLAKGLLSVLLLGAGVVFVSDFSQIGYKALIYLVLSGILGIAVSDSLFFSALKSLSPQAVALLFSLGQVVTILLAVLFLNEQLNFKVWTGIALTVTGVAVGIFPDSSVNVRSSARGIILGGAAVILMSIAVVFTKKGLAEVSPLSASFIRMISGTSGILLLGIVTGRLGSWVTPFRNVQIIRSFAFSVVIITFGGYLLSAVALKNTSVAVANSLFSTDSILILPFSALFLKERISVRAAVGAITTIAGIIIICFASVS